MTERIQPNAFAPAFIDLVESAFDWPVSIGETRFAGPWTVEPAGDRAGALAVRWLKLMREDHKGAQGSN